MSSRLKLLVTASLLLLGTSVLVFAEVMPVAPLYSRGPARTVINNPYEQAASSTGTAGAAVSVTAPAIVGFTTVLDGFDLTCQEPGAVESSTLSVSGPAGGSMTYQVVESATAGTFLSVAMWPGLPASAADTAITVSLPAIASGSACSLDARFHYAA
jgi:hypothetical protein